MSKNVFENKSFFERYMELRSDYNYNDLLEHPEMNALLPDLKGKRVIDLGCGYGSYSKEFIKKGCSAYVGIDSSDMMINKAKEENNFELAEYRCLNLDNLDEIDEKFDLAYSSLVFHYISDFKKLLKDINNLLAKDGILLFSQMHPIITASPNNSGYFEGDYFAFTGYQEEGKREGRWFKEKVVSYHRKVSTIINNINESGFVIENITEPIPPQDALFKLSDLERDLIRPTFLIIRARKAKIL